MKNLTIRIISIVFLILFFVIFAYDIQYDRDYFTWLWLLLSILSGLIHIQYMIHDIVWGKISGQTQKKILDEMDSDMVESGVAAGEIQSLKNHWRNKYIIFKK